MKTEKSLLQKTFDGIKSLFLGGLFTLLPIALTIAFFTFTLRLIQSWFNPIYLIVPTYLRTIPYVEIMVVLVTIFIVGAIVKFLLLQPLIEAIEKYFVGRIPLIRPVYFGIKQLIRAFGPQDTEHFQKVILIEFPRSGVYSIGFLTTTVATEIAPCKPGQEGCPTYFGVFIPNTPNPTTGYYVIAEEKDLQYVNLTRQEAMTIVISGGIIQPERLEKK
jgi:uncharacterized membrane protein